MNDQRLIPLWFKIAYTATVAIIAAPYSLGYGFPNFLWFSNIALLVTVATVWLELRLLASMQLLAVGLLEIVWSLDLLLGFVFAGDSLIGLTAFMFDEDLALHLRLFALYHVPLPLILLWLVWRLGYDERALWAQTLFGWSIMLITWLFTQPHHNINWVFGFDEPQDVMPPWLYLLLMMLAFPLLIYLPTHLLVRWAMGRRRSTLS